MSDFNTSYQEDSFTPLSNQVWDQSIKPELTVLVFSYNQAKYIEECINAVLQQRTNFRVEIIIHDDASTDDTQHILKIYKSRYPELISLLIQDENQFNKNADIYGPLHRLARGQYIARCDGDDFWCDSLKLQKQVDFLKECPDYVLSFHNANIVNTIGEILCESYIHESGLRDYSASELRELKWGLIPLSSACYRNVIREFPFGYMLVQNGDLFFSMLLGKYGGAKFQSEIRSYAYRQHEGNSWDLHSIDKKNQMLIESFLYIVAYFIGIGEIDTAKKITSSRLIPRLNEFINPNSSS